LIHLSFFKTFNIKIDTVLDIGARKGDWTKEFLEHFPESKSLMIEANGDHKEDLETSWSLYISISW
jgi:hypothetical protein